MIFARIGHGPCYYHWNEIFAGVSSQYVEELVLLCFSYICKYFSRRFLFFPDTITRAVHLGNGIFHIIMPHLQVISLT
jgi:hypothetical protein